MTGYNEAFLDGVNLPLPTFSIELDEDILRDNPKLRDGHIADYIHYSVVMNANKHRRSPVFVALNIDQNKHKKTDRSNRWKIDSRIGFENQLNNEYYKRNDWDRGHMARRTTAAWGDSGQAAQRASNETFYYSNSCLQHANLNQDEWLNLEDWVYNLSDDMDDKITSFSGPFYGELDRTIQPSGRELALIPSGFFKVVCFINKETRKLDVRAFVMYQDDEILKDKDGRKRYKNQAYQVSVSEVERLTGLQFDDAVYEGNPLYHWDRDDENSERNDRLDDLNIIDLPEAQEVNSPDDILAADTERQTVKDDAVDIYIAAAMANPEGRDRGSEWVSLINLGADTINLSNWVLKDNAGKVTLGAVTLEPGMAHVVKDLGTIRLSNKKDVISLFDGDDARIDRVDYQPHMVKEGQPILFLQPRDTLK